MTFVGSAVIIIIASGGVYMHFLSLSKCVKLLAVRQGETRTEKLTRCSVLEQRLECSLCTKVQQQICSTLLAYIPYAR